MPSVKIVIAGPPGAGKTTMIGAISDVVAAPTGRDISDHSRPTSVRTLDFGRVTVDRDLVLYLLSAAVPDELDAMWETLGEGALGSVLVVDHSNPDSFPQAAGLLRSLRRQVNFPVLIALNTHDSQGEQRADESALATLGSNHDGPVISMDASDRNEVKRALVALLQYTMDGHRGDRTMQKENSG